MWLESKESHGRMTWLAGEQPGLDLPSGPPNANGPRTWQCGKQLAHGAPRASGAHVAFATRANLSRSTIRAPHRDSPPLAPWRKRRRLVLRPSAPIRTTPLTSTTLNTHCPRARSRSTVAQAAQPIRGHAPKTICPRPLSVSPKNTFRPKDASAHAPLA